MLTSVFQCERVTSLPDSRRLTLGRSELDPFPLFHLTTKLTLYLICIRPYKPPELIFASRTYSPPALDLWALACLLAEFFTPLSLPLSSTPSSLGSDERRWKEAMSDGEDDPPDEGKSTRETLFDGSKTDFALTGSIFKLLGTPTAVSWPVSYCLLALTDQS